MTVALRDGRIVLEGRCGVEEAEELVAQLLASPNAVVDVNGCLGAHGAVVQALLTFRPSISGSFADLFLERWARPILSRNDAVA